MTPILRLMIGAAALALGAAAPSSERPDWAYAVPPDPNVPGASATPPDDGTLYALPGAKGRYTATQIRGGPGAPPPGGPVDWYPGDHPPMPAVVAVGDAARGVRPCALCHYPNGKGRSENAPVAGLPAAYIVRQLNDMRAGLRNTAEPKKANVAAMVAIARAMTGSEIGQAATYYAAMRWTPWIRVVESPTAPKVRSAGGLLIPLEGAAAGVEPIGMRIVEVPEKPANTEMARDPHSGFVAYAPPGAIARGRALVTTDGNGRTQACATCHGTDLQGVGEIPGIAARSPSYIARQLNDFREGARQGTLSAMMQPVAARLTNADMVDIAAYLASRPAPKAKG